MRVLVIFVMFCISTLFAQIPIYEKSSNSTFKEYDSDHGVVRKLENNTFEISTIHFNAEWKPVLFKVLNTKEYVSSREGANSRYLIKAFYNNQYKNKLWEIENDGDIYHINNSHVILKSLGGVTLGHYHFYDVHTGMKFLTTTTDIQIVDIPNASGFIRNICFLSSNTYYDIPAEDKKENLIGILYYTNQYLIREKVYIIGDWGGLSHNPEISFTDNDKEESNLSLWDSNGETSHNGFSGFEIKLKFWEEHELVFPIDDDKVNHDFIQNNSEIQYTFVSVMSEADYLFSNKFNNFDYKTKAELRLLRNEIFARHGHAFDDEELDLYFKTQPWYFKKENYKASRNDLTTEEQKMVEIISNYEKLK